MKRLRRLARFVRAHQQVILHFESSKSFEHANVKVDANYGGDGEDLRSTSGGFLYLDDVMLMSWSRTQATPALSSAEAEFYGIVTGVCEAMFLQQLLEELQVKVDIRVYTDSSGAKGFSERVGCGRLKHIAVRELFVKQLAASGVITLSKVKGTLNEVDLLTKALNPKLFQNCLALCKSSEVQ